MKKDACCALVLAITMFLCTGCWDSTEIDRLAIVTASGVDLVEQPDDAEGQDTSQGESGDQGQDATSQGQSGGQAHPVIRGVVQIARASDLGATGGGSPTVSTGSTDAFVLEEGEGSTLLATLERIRKRLSRKLFMGQRRVVVVGENYARHGVAELMDEVVRNPQSRLRTYIVIAYHDDAKSILELPYALNRLPSDAIVDLEHQGSAVEVDAKQFIQRLEGLGDPFAMGIVKIPSLHKVSNKSGDTFELKNIALFRGDKLVGWLEGDTVDGFNWIYGRVQSSDVTVRVKGPSGGLISARMVQMHTSRHARIKNGQPYIEIQTSAQFDVGDNASGLNLADPRNLQTLKVGIQQSIVARMEATVDAVKAMHTDPFGFSDLLDKRYPGVWRRLQPTWPTVYAKMPVKFGVDVDIRNGGLIGPVLKKSSNV